MIDFHTHILPGIDDGAKDIDESIKLLDSLKSQGVDTVVFTPHYYGINKGVKQFLEKRNAAYERLEKAYAGEIKFLLGSECNLSTCANNDFTSLAPLALENTRYILIEMAFSKDWDNTMWQRIDKLLGETNLVPVIAHIELYPAVQKNPDYAHSLIDRGCLLQMNCQSVLGSTQKDLAWALLSHGQIHCLGSDTHNLSSRPPLYAQAVERLRRCFGALYVDDIQQNMAEIIDDGNIKVRPSKPIKRKLFKYV